MGERLNILIVDDEETLLDIFKQYLESFDRYTVFTARNGFEALNIIKNEKVDCCFTDISMPRMDGLELVKKIHLHDNTIPVVVITGYPSMDRVISTLKNGVIDFLTKPVKLDQIPLTIDKVMRERALFINNILLKEETEKNQKLLRINKELEQKVKEVETMNLILQQLNQVTTNRELFDMLVNLSGQITACDEAHFCISAQNEEAPTIITSFFRNRKKAQVNSRPVEVEILQKVVADGMPLIIKENHGSDNLMAIPLKIRNSIFGILVSLIKGGTHQFSERELYMMHFLAEKASSLVENLALYENIYENLFSTLYAFVETIEARDPYTRQHSTRVTGYATLIAKALGCSQKDIEVLNVSCNLHDIGKIGIPDKILLKPGRLTDEEYEVIKKHPIIGANIVGHFSMWTDEQAVIKHHHERWDRRGYPDGLGKDEIPFLSRILSVSDVFDALTSERSYRKKLPDGIAAKIIRENSGTQFDPRLVEAFLDLFHEGKISSEEPAQITALPPKGH
ncbi:MAG: response regulator [Deltaproteobacteria bacterium]|nr:response regulator [Deltaproteobacteria bacterium]MBW1919735.1 response regulator [Deltaproteobacteria bacterium]MBW1935880.1 response regulator [Deltaproteobacteria bacterium]MBW1978527.1 response regulator [Deltaproteobacteria bacterium]MBW2045325.1 response regulator [Deltaproteobacteria bacterium]